jgi:acetyl-CoA carboxylase biotin carboxyl carrier protein
MDLTNEDVMDILALLDSLPYDELDLQTPRFRLTLRRTPDGWTQSLESRSSPRPLDAPAPGASLAPAATPPATPAPPVLEAAPPATPAPPVLEAAPPGAPAGAPATGAPATGSMEHRAGYNRPNGASSRLSSDAGEADEVEGATGISTRATGAGRGGQDARQGASEVDAELVAVRAPLPGTFYRAPRPGAAAFVEVGSRVGADTVVGIVETMKLFNSVTAGAVGTVADICLGNAEFADLGATLLVIRAD